MATVIKIVYNVTNPVIKVTYDVTNVTIGGQEIAPVYINMDYSSSSAVTVITSVGLTMPTGFSVANSPLTSSGTLAVTYSSGYSLPTTTKQSEWDQAYNDKINSASVSGTTTKTLTLNQQDGGTIQASWTDENTDAVTSVFGRTGAITATEGDYNLGQLGDVTLTSPTNGQVLKYNGTTWVNNTDTDTGLTSVGLSMPVAFSVANTPLTSNGTLAVSAAGTSAQYIRGDGQLANFPTNGGGGSAYNYYLNGSVSQGTFGGVTYYEMSKTPILGAGTDFTRTNAQGNGYIASFITDANDPSLLSIPGGNWNLEFYFSASSGGGGPQFYAELYKVDASNNFTLVASGVTNPEGIDNGTIVDQYFTSISVPLTSLALTDRLAVRIYVIPDGRNIVLHTENSNLCEILTTFSTGLNALNGLTAQVQYFATGTSGTDFAISSATDTHTFNLPTASATNRGALSSADWTAFNSKVPSTRQLTINGTAYDLSADRSWSVGTISSLNSLTGATQTFAKGTYGNQFNIVSSGTTHTFNIPIASATNDEGLLSNLDWIAFDAKEDVLTFSAPLSRSVNTVSIPAANSSQPGYLTSSDWTTFNAKVTSVSATSPLSSSGGATPTLTIQQSSGSQNGYLSSTDWMTFNAKQDALNGTGFVKISGTTISYDNSTYYLASNPNAYIALTALSAGAGISYNNTTGVISSTITQYTNADARLAISETVTGLDYDNSTGVFSLTTGYVIPTTSSATNWDAAYNDKINSASVTGTTTKTLTLTQQDGGTITASWTDINTDAVTSVFGRTGAVVATSGDYTTTLVTEGTNLYYTEGRVSANTDVAANTAARHSAVTLGTANGLSLSTQQLSLGLSSSSANGALSSTDWSTFNAKQNAITLTTTGSSGSATLVGATLNIPSYSVAGLGAVPDNRTITINGEVYDLSANRTFEVGDYGTF